MIEGFNYCPYCGRRIKILPIKGMNNETI